MQIGKHVYKFAYKSYNFLKNFKSLFFNPYSFTHTYSIEVEHNHQMKGKGDSPLSIIYDASIQISTNIVVIPFPLVISKLTLFYCPNVIKIFVNKDCKSVYTALLLDVYEFVYMFTLL